MSYAIAARSLLLIVPLAAGHLACASDAGAQVTPQQQSALRSNCRSDFTSKCSGVTPGGKDALACLQRNVASLSPACKTAVSATIPKPAPVQAAPAPVPAVSKPAPTAAAPPKASIATPAQAPAPQPPKASLATPAAPPPPPKAAVAPPPPKAAVTRPPARPAKPAAAAPSQPTAAQQSAIKSACRSDFTSRCSGVSPGGKDALACLQKNVASLSATCKKAVSATISAPATAKVTPASAPAPAAAAAPRLKAPIANAAVMLRACKLDLIRHCRGVSPGGGRELACLAAHESSLTIRCRTARKVTAPLR